jgi:hypothetical protein
VAFDEVTANYCRMDRFDGDRHLEASLDRGHVGRLLVDDAKAVVGQIASPVDAGQARRWHVDLDHRQRLRRVGGQRRASRKQLRQRPPPQRQSLTRTHLPPFTVIITRAR